MDNNQNEVTFALLRYLIEQRDHWRDRATEERTLVASRDRTIAQLRDVNRTLSEDALAKRSAPPSPAVGVVVDGEMIDRMAAAAKAFGEHLGQQDRLYRLARAALTSAQLVPLASATPIATYDGDTISFPQGWGQQRGPLYVGLPQPAQREVGDA